VGEAIPVFVDLDGTLVKTDLLAESALALLREKPWSILLMSVWLLRGKAYLKARLAEVYDPKPESLPYDQAVCEYLQQQALAGRNIYLATASDFRIASAVAKHHALFRGVVASDGIRNLKGTAKLAAIKEVSKGDFEYVGNEAADLPIWKAAKRAVLVNVPASVRRKALSIGNVTHVFETPAPGFRAYLRTLRAHQWLKNLLIFVPLMTSHQMTNLESMTKAIVAFVAFSLCASATYILNDLFDLSSDRVHPRKRNRPFAAGDVSIAHGVVLAIALLTGGLVMAAVLSWKVLALLVGYVVLTSTYSLTWKTYFLIDVLTLAGLYTLRILVGAAAISVTVSFWLLAFSVFLFFSLALVKRCTELALLETRNQRAARGRDYRISDVHVLQAMGIASGYAGVLVFALYIDNPQVTAQYGTPQLLWFVCCGLLYWISRMWVKTARGEMHDDPLIYAVKDRGGRLVILSMLVISGLAYFLHL
jgi:4-hydroxybenzoate polyprenyltransferase/phosphoserine phosphatase